MISTRKILALLALNTALASALATGCKKDEPKSTRWDDAAAPVTTVQISPSGAPSAPAIQSGVLPKFFPKDNEGGYKRIHSADKEGYAEAKLQKDGKEVAILSIADAEKLAYAKTKFESVTDKLDGYPVMTVGNNQTSVLVKGRFLVKVSSPTLDNDARKAILSKFDLKGLEGT